MRVLQPDAKDTPRNPRAQQLSKEDRDRLACVYTWTGSAELLGIVTRHVEGVIFPLDHVYITDVELVMSGQSRHRGYATSNVQSVVVRLSNSAVIQIGVEVTYVTRSVLYLPPHDDRGV